MPDPIEALLRPRPIAALGAAAEFRKLEARKPALNPMLCSAEAVIALDSMMVLRQP